MPSVRSRHGSKSLRRHRLVQAVHGAEPPASRPRHQRRMFDSYYSYGGRRMGCGGRSCFGSHHHRRRDGRAEVGTVSEVAGRVLRLLSVDVRRVWRRRRPSIPKPLSSRRARHQGWADSRRGGHPGDGCDARSMYPAVAPPLRQPSCSHHMPGPWRVVQRNPRRTPATQPIRANPGRAQRASRAAWPASEASAPLTPASTP